MGDRDIRKVRKFINIEVDINEMKDGKLILKDPQTLNVEMMNYSY